MCYYGLIFSPKVARRILLSDGSGTHKLKKKRKKKIENPCTEGSGERVEGRRDSRWRLLLLVVLPPLTALEIITFPFMQWCLER